MLNYKQIWHGIKPILDGWINSTLQDIFLKKNGVSGVDSSIPHHVTVRAIPRVPLGWGYHSGNNMFVEVSLLKLSWNLGLLSDAIKFLKNIQFPLYA